MKDEAYRQRQKAHKEKVIAHRREMYRVSVRLRQKGRVPQEYVDERRRKLEEVLGHGTA